MTPAQPQSRGMEMFTGLSEQLGIGDFETQPKKKIKTNELGISRAFDPEQDAFKMTTHMIKIITQVFECSKDNVVANVKFDTTGVTIFALYHSKTVCINTHLGKDLFSKLVCEREVHTSLNLSVLAKKISNLQKFKIQTLTFESQGDDLVLTGRPETGPQAKIHLKSLSSDVEELDLCDFKYSVPIRLSASEFAKRVECMPATFTIHMDTELGCLVFIGDEDHSTTTLTIELDAQVLEEVKKHPDVRNYRATFVKANISSITKGHRLSEYVVVAMSQDSPLFVRYVVNESSDLCPEHDSKVEMYFSPKLNDDLDEC